MDKLADKIIRFSLARPLFIFLMTAFVVLMGVYAFKHTPIDVYPDVTSSSVTIITQWSGRSAEEVEKFITIPIEIAMNPVQDKTDIRSTTLFGLSVVKVIFEDKVDDFVARQQVYNMLQDVSLPSGANTEVQPLSGPTGEIYRYTLRSKNHSVRELKTLQDWVIDRNIRSVSGVADVVSFGGEVKTYQVSVNPQHLTNYGISSLELFDAIEKSNINVGGDVITKGTQAYVVRGIGLIENIEEIKNIVVKNIAGRPILVRHLADVHEHFLPRLGQVGRQQESDVVEGIILMRKGEHTEEVILRLKKQLAHIQKNLLPHGVEIISFYDREELTDKAVSTVMHNVIEGIVLVTLIVLLFMADWRTTLIVGLIIPLSLLFTFICLYALNMSANLLSMGAIDFGIIIDGAVLMVEGIFVRLDKTAHSIGMRRFNLMSKLGIIHRVSSKRAHTILFSKLIIITALIPIFTFQKVEGKLFSPLAYTLSFALLGALIFSLTLVPVLCAMLLKKNVHERSTFFIRAMLAISRRLFDYVYQRKKRVLILSTLFTFVALMCYRFLGGEFLPHLNEGAIYVRATLPQSVSLDKSIVLADSMRRLISGYEEVQEVLSQTGRPNDGTDATGFYNVEFMIKNKDIKTWKSKKTKAEFIADLQRDLSIYPGIDFNFSQPISDNVEEAVSGVKGSIAVKIFSPDIVGSEQTALDIKDVLHTVRGIEDVGVIRSTGQPELRIELREHRLARYGIEKQNVQSIIEMAIGGKVASVLYDGERKFSIVVRYDKQFRYNEESIGRILVPAASGTKVPIRELATIRTITGPLLIFRNNHERFCAVKFSVRGRDMLSAIEEAQQKVATQIHIPDTYRLAWTGDFENQQRAMARLAQVVPISIVIIFLILFVMFSKVRDALMVLINVPFAAAGGILALLITGFHFSISSGIGFIALFGICILNGVIMIVGIKENMLCVPVLSQAVQDGVRSRIRAVVMTALMAILGLLPAALSHGIGSESQRPLAIVIIGGLITGSFFNIFIFPLWIEWIYSKSLYKQGKLMQNRL